MQSVRMPVLTTTGKNLASPTLLELDSSGGNVTSTVISTNVKNQLASLMKIEPNKQIVISKKNKGKRFRCFFFDQEPIPNVTQSIGGMYSDPTNVLTVTSPSNAKYLFVVWCNDKTTEHPGDFQVEYGTVATSHQPHKSNILTCNEEVELRGIGEGSNRVEDELNLLTGECVQRIGEITFDGSEDWAKHSISSDDYFVGVVWDVISNAKDGSNLISNKLKGMQSTREDSVMYIVSQYPIITFHKSSLDSMTIESFKKKLSELNPTIQYPLATESVKTVDLSDNVVYSYDEVTHYDCSSESGSLVPTLSIKNEVSYKAIIKPSTKYSVVFNRTKIGESLRVNLGGTEVGVSTSVVGKNIVGVTTPSTLSHELVKFIGTGNFIKDVQVIEGDVAGDEPYFEGIIDCKSPILSNVGKNLWDIDKLSDVICTQKTNNSFVVKSWASTILTNQQIREMLKPNTKYAMRAKFKLLKGSSLPLYSPSVQFFLYSPTEQTTNVTFLLSGSEHIIGKEYEVVNVFTTPRDFGDKNLLAYSKRYANESTYEYGEVEFTDVQLEEMSQATEYEPYKSNTTTFDQKDGKTIVLRSLPNGVCDTLNVETGEYIQRIGEVVFDGSSDEQWKIESNDNHATNRGFTMIHDSSVERSELVCDKLPFANINNWSNKTELGITKGSSSLGVCVLKTVANSVEAFRTWLSQNPITIQYQLATPIVRKVDLSGFPYAYANGHVILSSGSVEQSLTPSIEYKVATNRGSQITQNTKSVMRQSILLDEIEGKINKILEATARDNIALLKLKNK